VAKCNILGRYVGIASKKNVNGGIGMLSIGEIQAFSERSVPQNLTAPVNLLVGKSIQ